MLGPSLAPWIADRRSLRTALCVCIGIFVWIFPSTSAAEKAKGGPGKDLFRDNLIPRIEILVDQNNYGSLRRNQRRYVRCTIKSDGLIYTNAAIRLKGGPGSFRPIEDKPGFTINFDKFAEGQKFHGLKKIHLNNSVQDGSFLSEQVAREMFNAAGIPTPRAGHAVVALNGDLLGFYVLVEGIDKQFLKQHYEDPTGDVYDGHSQTDIAQKLPLNAGKGDWTKLRALAAAVRESNLDLRAKKLEQTLDVDRFLSFTAMELLLGHWDGYTRNRNNFRIFHDKAADRLVFFPQGLDQLLRQDNFKVLPPFQSQALVTRAVFEIPEFQARYRDRVGQLLTNVFQMDALSNRIHEISRKIEESLAESDASRASASRTHAQSLVRRLQLRKSNVERQLLPNQTTAASFDRGIVKALKGWQPQVDKDGVRLTREEGNILHIKAEGDSAGSWRTAVVLQRGSYSFRGRLKTRGIELTQGDTRPGAGFRISHGKYGRTYTGDNDWTDAAYDFEVQEDGKEVVLICELRASRGESWFDLDSLRLRLIRK